MLDRLIDIAQLDFGNDQAQVLTGENIDLPRQAAMWNHMARLLDDGAFAKLHERFGLQHRNGILQFQPPQIRGTRLDGERCGSVAADANPGRRFSARREIGLPNRRFDLKRARASRCRARGTCARSRNSLAHAMMAANPENAAMQGCICDSPVTPKLPTVRKIARWVSRALRNVPNEATVRLASIRLPAAIPTARALSSLHRSAAASRPTICRRSARR